MFSIIDEAKIREYPNKSQTVKTFVCLSTDDKPTEGIANGAQAIEMDTGKIYMFNMDDEEWVEVSISGGGSGSGSVPTPTSQDVGKGLSVGGTKSDTPVVPTVTIPMLYYSEDNEWAGDQEISDTIPDWWVAGTKLYATVGDVTYPGIIVDLGEMGLGFQVNVGSTYNQIGISEMDGTLSAWASWTDEDPGASIDVTFYLEQTGWVIDSYPGDDIIIKCNGSFSSTASDYELVKFDYDSIIAKVRNFEKVSGVAFCAYDYNEVGHNDSYYVLPLVSIGEANSQGRIILSFTKLMSITVSGFNISNMSVWMLIVFVDPDGTITGVEIRAGSRNF